MPGSNQQLIKYTDSVKKFNELMVRFVIGRDIPPNIILEQDSEAFQKLRQKATNKEAKSTSTGGGGYSYTPKALALTPSKGISPASPGQTGGKSEFRNGAFLKPKNYLISEHSREVQSLKMQKKWSGEEGSGVYLGLMV